MFFSYSVKIMIYINWYLKWYAFLKLICYIMSFGLLPSWRGELGDCFLNRVGNNYPDFNPTYTPSLEIPSTINSWVIGGSAVWNESVLNSPHCKFRISLLGPTTSSIFFKLPKHFDWNILFVVFFSKYLSQGR